MGAPGLESDVRLSADGVPVLVHDAVVGRRPRRRTVAAMPRRRLPAGVPSLAELYEAVGPNLDLSLDVKDPAAAAPTVATARAAGAVGRLWLCGSLDELPGWRRLDRDVRLVDSTRLRAVRERLPERARSVLAAGAQALNLPAAEWDAERVRLVQREGVLAFAWDAHTPAAVQRLRGLGVDAIYGDDVRALLAA